RPGVALSVGEESPGGRRGALLDRRAGTPRARPAVRREPPPRDGGATATGTHGGREPAATRDPLRLDVRRHQSELRSPGPPSLGTSRHRASGEAARDRSADHPAPPGRRSGGETMPSRNILDPIPLPPKTFLIGAAS